MPYDLQSPGSMAEAEAYSLLNSVTAALQEGRTLHREAAATFSSLIDSLPAGKLKCSALLNRAHCLVGLGEYTAALSDIEQIVSEDAPGVDAKKWHKVWMSRGGIHRKLAQTCGGDPALYAKARADYERVITIDPPHEGYVTKALRCLQQLEALERRPARTSDAHAPPGGRGAAAPSSPARAEEGASAPTQKRRRLRLPSREGLGAAGSPGTDAAPSAAPQPRLARTVSARTSLKAFGQDISTAGRQLFDGGAVRERAGAAPSSPVRSGGASTGSRSPVAPGGERLFEIRSPLGGPSEQVVLRNPPSPRPTDSAAGLGVPSCALGECSCRLRGHCKHVAAVLWAIDREEIAAAAGVARPGDPSARRRRDRLEKQLEKRTNDELKNYLRLNNQLLSGIKADLARRVADCAVFGTLPVCPKCGGHLHLEGAADVPDALARCRKLNRDREACGYEATMQELERKPFIGGEQLF